LLSKHEVIGSSPDKIHWWY